MTLTELRYIVDVPCERHFGRAAEDCIVSQPTLSVATKKLEQELDVKLFERGSSEGSVRPLAAFATGNVIVTLTWTSAAQNVWGFGTLTWSDGVRNVVSPLSDRVVGFSAPAQVTGTRASGTSTKIVSVVSACSGWLSGASVGLVPATRNTSIIVTGAVQCYNFAVPEAAQLARLQLFNADTSAASDPDLDEVNGPNGTGIYAGSIGDSTSNEVATRAG